jgi:hypothetical protein
MAAKNIRERIEADPSDTSLAEEVRVFFGTELEPHFKAEEALMDHLESHWGSKDPDLARTRQEHEALRRLADSGRPGEIAFFGEALKAHIHYEEEVLFGRFEGSLTPEEAEAWGVRFTSVTPSQPSNPLASKH